MKGLHSQGLLESVLTTLTLTWLFCGCGGCAGHVLTPVFPIPSPHSSTARKSIQNKTLGRVHLHHAPRSKQVIRYVVATNPDLNFSLSGSTVERSRY